MEEYIYKEENYQIVGVLFEVHRNLGKGFSEIVYKDAIEYEFQEQSINMKEKKSILSATKTLPKNINFMLIL
jgi:GxxExxY protein